MTLAFLLFLGALTGPSAAGNPAPEAEIEIQTSAASSQPTAQQSQGSTANSAQETGEKPTSASTQQSSPAQSQPAKKASKHKKNSSANCRTISAQNSDSKRTSSSEATDAGKKSTSSSCPPSKVIVRQGSTSDSSIELVGGAAGSQASDERNNSIEMLETADANLKKIDGTQLDSNQQDMIKQVRQFMDQSKAATSAGDLDQARTLAWKAQLLSEELLKKQK
jgi:hypothetical protein